MAWGRHQPFGADLAIVAFVIAILDQLRRQLLQETLVGGVAENVLFDIRRAMFWHLQRVSLPSWTRRRSAG